jgi:hypothetical protein
MKHREEQYLAVMMLFAAVLIAAGHVTQGNLVSLAGNYLYWIVRIFIEGLLFLAARQVLEKYLPQKASFMSVTGIAILVSHPLFVLSVTAMDIVLGYPELGIETNGGVMQSRTGAFMLELLYLSDNHIALCALLSLPRLLLNTENPSERISSDSQGTAAAEPTRGQAPTLLSAIDPPLSGQISWMEAQEHYVRITTDEEVRMVLCRFSDIVRELSDDAGMQTHRSHWAAYPAIAEAVKEGQNMKLVLTSGDSVPVSRSFRSTAEAKLERLPVS